MNCSESPHPPGRSLPVCKSYLKISSGSVFFCVSNAGVRGEQSPMTLRKEEYLKELILNVFPKTSGAYQMHPLTQEISEFLLKITKGIKGIPTINTLENLSMLLIIRTEKIAKLLLIKGPNENNLHQCNAFFF
jgi:hypothetical protein